MNLVLKEKKNDLLSYQKDLKHWKGKAVRGEFKLTIIVVKIVYTHE